MYEISLEFIKQLRSLLDLFEKTLRERKAMELKNGLDEN